MARSSECTDEYAQNELIEPTLSETLIEPETGPDALILPGLCSHAVGFFAQTLQ
jgi:hypothetical protein